MPKNNNNNNSNNNVSKNQNQNIRRRNSMQRLHNPPMWNSSARIQFKQRYLTTSAINGRSIRTVELFNCKQLAATAISGYSIFQGLKILKVEMFCSNATGATPLTLELAWEDIVNQYFGSPGSNISDTAMGVSDVAHVSSRPPKNSFADSWLPLNAATNEFVFTINCPAGTIIDVTFDTFLVSDQGPPTPSILVGATPGILYTRPLDNFNASPAIIPLVVFTI